LTLLLLDLPKYNFTRQLTEVTNFRNSFVVEVVQEQGFSPQILEKIVLLEHDVVDEKEIKVKASSVLEYGFRLCSEGIIDVEQVVEAHLFVPIFNIYSLFSWCASCHSYLLVKMHFEDALTFEKFA
jgi:hypothetical protein